MATKKKPSAKQLAARAKFAAMARARAKAAKGKKTITKKTTTKKIGSLLSKHKPFFKKISKATAKKRFIENMEVYGLYDDGSESLIESLNDLDNRGIYAYGYEIKSGKMGKTTKSRHTDTKSHNVKISVMSGNPIFEYKVSQGGKYYVTSNIPMKGVGITQIGDGSDHKRNLKTYLFTELALKKMQKTLGKENTTYIESHY